MLVNDAAGGMTPIPVEEEAAREDFASNYPGIGLLLKLLSCWLYNPVTVKTGRYISTVSFLLKMHLITPFNYPPATNQLP